MTAFPELIRVLWAQLELEMSAVTTFVWLSVLITTLLVMSKLRGGFNYRWEYAFSPVSTTLLGSGIWHLILLYLERSAQAEHEKGSSFQVFIHQQKARLLDLVVSTLESLGLVVVILDLSEFLNRVSSGKERHPTADRLCYSTLAFALVSLVLRLQRSAQAKSIEMIEEEGEEYYLEWRKNTRFPVVGIFLNQVFNLLGATTMVCAGGACNSLYISSITLFFSSIGISLTDWLPFLNGLGFVFVIVALVSLYSAKKSVLYPPFYLGCLFSLIILLEILGLFHSVPVLVVANVGMIGCSLYNLKNNMAPIVGRKKNKRKKRAAAQPTDLEDLTKL